MLPYIELPTLGPITSFGIFAMLGVSLGVAAGSRRAEQLGLDREKVKRLATWCGIGGILGAHYVDLFLYQPGWTERPDAVWAFVNPFAGISSYGGLLGGTLGFLAYAHRARLQRLRYADAAAFGVIVLLLFGRAGCASVHDHIGVASSFPLAVDFPAGNKTGVVGPHHDLGLYELALFAVLVGVSVVVLRRPHRDGWFVAFVALGYAVPRFFLDFLRRESIDPRYGGLTPAQWASVATVLAAIAVLAWIYRPRVPLAPRSP